MTNNNYDISKEDLRVIYSYMLEPTSKQIYNKIVEYGAVTASNQAHGNLFLSELNKLIQISLLEAMKEANPGGYKMYDIQLSDIELPIKAFLYENLNHSVSFNIFWNCFREMLGHSAEMSQGKIRIYGNDSKRHCEFLKSSGYEELYTVNLLLSAFNSLLINKFNYINGYLDEGIQFLETLHLIESEMKKKSELYGWEKDFLYFAYMLKSNDNIIDGNLLLSLAINMFYGNLYLIKKEHLIAKKRIEKDNLQSNVKCLYDEWENHLNELIRVVSFYIFNKDNNLDDTAIHGSNTFNDNLVLIKHAINIHNSMMKIEKQMGRNFAYDCQISRFNARIEYFLAYITTSINLYNSYNYKTKYSIAITTKMPFVVGHYNKVVDLITDCFYNKDNLKFNRFEEIFMCRIGSHDMFRYTFAAINNLNLEKCVEDAHKNLESYFYVVDTLKECASNNISLFEYLMSLDSYNDKESILNIAITMLCSDSGKSSLQDNYSNNLMNMYNLITEYFNTLCIELNDIKKISYNIVKPHNEQDLHFVYSSYINHIDKYINYINNNKLPKNDLLDKLNKFKNILLITLNVPSNLPNISAYIKEKDKEVVYILEHYRRLWNNYCSNKSLKNNKKTKHK